jgi:hypothetical protein
MADDKVHPTATEMDYPAHYRNYDGFIQAVQIWRRRRVRHGMVVIYVIYN